MDYKLRIREIREKRDMTQTELARKCKLNQSYISQLERADTNAKSPTLRIVFRIAKALDVCPHLIVEYNMDCSENCIKNCNKIFFK